MEKNIRRIQTRGILTRTIARLKQQGNTIVFTNGCFDLVHPGHIAIFKQAKQKGDVLVVGMNSDKSVKKIKGPTRPILNERARSLLVSAIRYVDYVVLFDEETPYQLIRAIRPDYLVKGGDWKPGEIVGRDLVKKVFRVKLIKTYSTTNIIKKIVRGA
ncbi:MAG: adenylyltransferase/cytidyltransferase family protein [Candidatus Omnitrophica bacterium]|nr:adenylyltransferase/cytidyltransferase family protein [Candidatus Omnitrophota bacterium]